METRFAKLINSKIKERNLTKRELAEYLDISESMLSKILSGERNIDLDKLNKISSYLEIDLQTLATLAEEAGIISDSVRQTVSATVSSLASSVGGASALGAGLAAGGGGLGFLLGGPVGAIIGAAVGASSSYIKDSVFKESVKEIDISMDDVIYAPPVQQDQPSNSTNEINLDELSLKQLKELAQSYFQLRNDLIKLKNYNFAIEYSLKGLVSDEFIAKIIQYIDFEIDMMKKTK